ncbi:alpha-ketoglutarate dependent xanthine dioxygenase [Seiridium cupressi]
MGRGRTWRNAIEAEIKLPNDMPTLEIGRLTEQDKQTLRKALFEDQVIVIRGQKGIEPTVLPELAKVFNESAIGAHSTGEKAVSDSRNILSAYKAGRIPQAPQVGIIGLGKFQDYDGIPKLEVIHLKRISVRVQQHAVFSDARAFELLTSEEQELQQLNAQLSAFAQLRRPNLGKELLPSSAVMPVRNLI